MSCSSVTIFVCVSCRVPVEGGGEGRFEKPGVALAAALKDELAKLDAATIEVRPVECLSVCKRPSTIAFAGPDKWTYILGGIDAGAPAEIITAAEAYAASKDGIVPWKDRPDFFKKGIIARVPPETYRMTETVQ